MTVSNGKIGSIQQLDDEQYMYYSHLTKYPKTNVDGLPIGKLGNQTYIDAGELLVSPGVIDSHVHLNQPGREHWEGRENLTDLASIFVAFIIVPFVTL